MIVSQSKMKYIKMSPRKLRSVIDIIRGKNVNKALNILNIMKNKGALFVIKALKNAINNTQNITKDTALDVDLLCVKDVFVDEGPTVKRWMPRAMGRASKINKRSSHLTLRLAEEKLKKKVVSSK